MFSLVSGAKVIHFGHLNRWPLKFIALLFYKNIFQLQGNAYDFKYSAAKIKYKKLTLDPPVGGNIVLFSKNIESTIFSKIGNSKKIYKFGEINNLHVTEKICDQILTLPMYPNMTNDEINYLVDSISEFFEYNN